MLETTTESQDPLAPPALVVPAPDAGQTPAPLAPARPAADPHLAPAMSGITPMLDRLLIDVQAAAAAEGCVEMGHRRCPCGKVWLWEDPPCECEKLAAEQARRAERSVYLAAAYESLPEAMDWSRVGNPVWEQACVAPFAKVAKEWKRSDGSLILAGYSGAGKTTATVALMARILDVCRDTDVDRKMFLFGCKARFVSVTQLSLAISQSPLGREPPLIAACKRASLLVLDDLGHEAPDLRANAVLFDVLTERYFKRAHTLVTTELNVVQLVSRYGRAMVRRMTDMGSVVAVNQAGEIDKSQWDPAQRKPTTDHRGRGR